MGGRSESDYREVALEREGKEPLHGFMRLTRGMVIVRGYGGHKETRLILPRDFVAVVLSDERIGEGLAQRSRPKSRRKRREWKLSASCIRPSRATRDAAPMARPEGA